MESIAAGTPLHRPDRVGARAARVALELIVCGECRIEFRLFARILASRLDAVINLAGGQLVKQIFWHSHEQQTRKCFYKEPPHPRCHFVCRWLSVMDVEDADRYHDR